MKMRITKSTPATRAKDRKALNDRLRRAWNLGVMHAVFRLHDRGWSADEVAERYNNMFLTLATEAIAAAGLNGGPATADLDNHMRRWGARYGTRLADARDLAGR